MDPADFDRLVARAADPRLIPGIYNYCDGRCGRCPFTERCLTFLDNRELESAMEPTTIAEMVSTSLQRTLAILTEVARREEIDLEDAANGDAAGSNGDDPGRHTRDPLAAGARQYAELAWRIAQALQPVVARRGDPAVIGAVDTIAWFSTLISAKIRRAICGQSDGWEDRDGVQTDHNGSAKVALLGIAESRAAWAVLMEAGRATADGVPAQAVKMLDRLECDLRTRFPRVNEFVRPGFDDTTAPIRSAREAGEGERSTGRPPAAGHG
ncbi:MAG: hypothetical protein ABI868_20790 [Acidobacteriota bacterium]